MNVVQQNNAKLNNALHELRSRCSNLSKNGAQDPVSVDTINKINSEIDSLQSSIQQKAIANRPIVRSEVANNIDRKSHLQSQYKKALSEYLKKGNTEMINAVLTTIKEQNPDDAATVTGDSTSGYSVGDAMDQMIRTSMSRSPFSMANLFRVSGVRTDFTSLDSFIQTQWGGETDAVAAQSTPFSRQTIQIGSLTMMPRIPNRMLQDPVLNILETLSKSIGVTLSNAIESACLLGTGVNQPKGILSYPLGTAQGQIERVASGSTSAITIASMSALQSKLSTQYLNPCFIVSPDVNMQLRTLTNSLGQYMLLPNFSVLSGQSTDNVPQSAMTLFGVPLFVSSNMPKIATNSLSAIYGDVSSGYQIVDAGITIKNDWNGFKPYCVYYVSANIGGAVVDVNAFKVLQMSLS